MRDRRRQHRNTQHIAIHLFIDVPRVARAVASHVSLCRIIRTHAVRVRRGVPLPVRSRAPATRHRHERINLHNPVGVQVASANRRKVWLDALTAPAPRPCPHTHVGLFAIELMYMLHGIDISALVSGRRRSETTEKLMASTKVQ